MSICQYYFPRIFAHNNSSDEHPTLREKECHSLPGTAQHQVSIFSFFSFFRPWEVNSCYTLHVSQREVQEHGYIAVKSFTHIIFMQLPWFKWNSECWWSITCIGHGANLLKAMQSIEIPWIYPVQGEAVARGQLWGSHLLLLGFRTGLQYIKSDEKYTLSSNCY